MPEQGKEYSANLARLGAWDPAFREFVRRHSHGGDADRTYSLRYIGALVADFHRVLLRGGVFLYPGDGKNPNGKLRLLYEAAPLAFLAEAAGGAASNGRGRILDVVPDGLHVRTPLIIGSRYEVSAIEGLLAGNLDSESALTASKGASP
jgi:fructose-1,6-bisphosphatase I